MREQDGRGSGGRRWAVAGGVLVAVVAFAGIGYLVGSSAIPENSQYLAPPDPYARTDTGAIPSFDGGNGAANAAQSVYAGPLPPDFTPAEAPVNSAIDDSEQAPPPDPAASDESANADAAETDADRQGAREIAAAIRDAGLAALAQGGGVRWHRDGLSGSAVAGPAYILGGRTCRDLVTTTLRGDGETRAPTVTWCDGGDGRWAPQ